MPKESEIKNKKVERVREGEEEVLVTWEEVVHHSRIMNPNHIDIRVMYLSDQIRDLEKEREELLSEKKLLKSVLDS